MFFKESNKTANSGLQIQKQQEMGDKAIKIEHQEDDDAAGKQQQKQPPKKMTKIINGKAYNFVKNVKSMEELEDFQFKNYCLIKSRKALPDFTSHTMPCTRKYWYCKPGKPCDFELLALRSERDTIDVYAHSAEHNHPFMREEQRAKFIRSHNHPAIKQKKKRQPAARGLQQKQPEQGMEVDEEEDNHEGNKVEEGQNELTKAGGGAGGGEQEDDIIVIDGEDDGIKIEQQQQEDKPKGSKEKPSETPQGNEANPRVETAKEKLQKSQAKAYYEWMAGFEANQIESTVKELDTDSVLKMVEMADQEIRQHPAKFALWRPWVEFAIKKCMFKIEGFGAKYKELIGLF